MASSVPSEARAWQHHTQLARIACAQKMNSCTLPAKDMGTQLWGQARPPATQMYNRMLSIHTDHTIW